MQPSSLLACPCSVLTTSRSWRTAAAAAFATAVLAVVTPAAHAAGTTLVLDTQENYYLPTAGEGPNLNLAVTASGIYTAIKMSRHHPH